MIGRTSERESMKAATVNACQPPRAVINRPKLRVPSVSSDCHAHILGPPARFPYVPDRSDTPPDALPEDFLRMLSTLGMEHMIVVQASC